MLAHLARQAPDLRDLRAIGDEGMRVAAIAADRGGDALRSLQAVRRDDGDDGALRSVALRDRFADALRGARDQCNFPREPHDRLLFDARRPR